MILNYIISNIATIIIFLLIILINLDVELDPVAELAVREIISNLGLIVVGW